MSLIANTMGRITEGIDFTCEVDLSLLFLEKFRDIWNILCTRSLHLVQNRYIDSQIFVKKEYYFL